MPKRLLTKSPKNDIKIFIIPILLLYIISYLYIPTIQIGFFYDDLLLHDLPYWPSSAKYSEISWLIFDLIIRNFGYNGAIFHFYSFSIHLLNTVLFLSVVRRLGASRPLAWMAMALWGLFPFAHEPVAYTIGSRNALVVFWLLLATAFALRPGRYIGIIRGFLAIISFIMAVLTYETGVLWPALLLGIDQARRKRFRGLRLLIFLTIGTGILAVRSPLLESVPEQAPLNFTLESALYAVQGWLYPFVPLLRPLWGVLFDWRPTLLRALRPEDWAFLGIGFGLTGVLTRITRPRWPILLGSYWFALSITPSLISWGHASGMMNYPRTLLGPGIGSALAWATILDSWRRRGRWGRLLAGAGLGFTLALSVSTLAASLEYYRDATRILRGMAAAAWEAGDRPILYVNLPYNVGYRWFRARFYPYIYGGAGAVLITTDRELARYIRLNGGPDLTGRPSGWVESRRLEALYPNWFTPAPPIDFPGLRDALEDHAVYVFREDLAWVPLHEIWRVHGMSDRVHAEAPPLEILEPSPRFDGRIALRGWRIDEEAGELLLAWEALAPPERRWHVFVHLLDEKGELLGQADGPMAGGLAPTEAWRTGDWVIDHRPLPPGIRPAALRLGLYDWTSGERATVEWGTLRPPDRYVVLATPR